jgi:NAD(P)-dependent dehydrogenase (short-subunit alcohol dehydrogenase family)
MRLKDKVIIITGSTTGIGKAIAIRCVHEGAKVLIHGLEEDWAKELVNQLTNANASYYIENLANEGVADRIIDYAIKQYGKIDAVINNAARQVSSNILTTDARLLREVLEINTVIPFTMIKAALPYLINSKGTVVNIGSVNAYSGEPNLLPYSISKGALMTMTRNLGDSLFREYGIRVNQLNPGWVLTETEIKRKKDQGLEDDWYKKLPNVFAPAGRILKPEEIANAIIYLLEDDSGPMSGQVIDIEQHPFIGRNPPKDYSTLSK